MARPARDASRDIRELSAHPLRQHRPEATARLTASVDAALTAPNGEGIIHAILSETGNLPRRLKTPRP